MMRKVVVGTMFLLIGGTLIAISIGKTEIPWVAIIGILSFDIGIIFLANVKEEDFLPNI